MSFIRLFFANIRFESLNSADSVQLKISVIFIFEQLLIGNNWKLKQQIMLRDWGKRRKILMMMMNIKKVMKWTKNENMFENFNVKKKKKSIFEVDPSGECLGKNTIFSLYLLE